MEVIITVPVPASAPEKDAGLSQLIEKTRRLRHEIAENELEKDGFVTEDGQFIRFSDGTYIDLMPTLDSPAFPLKAGDDVTVKIVKMKQSEK